MEKQNQSGECKSSSDSLEIDRLTAAAIARSWLNELISFTEYWRVSDASCLSLFPSRRDVWVRAVLEGDVTDQDSLPRGHWGHESCMQGSNQYWLSAFKACISSLPFIAVRFWHVCYLQLAREVLDIAAVMVKPGVTTEEIDHAVHLVRCFETRHNASFLDPLNTNLHYGSL